MSGRLSVYGMAWWMCLTLATGWAKTPFEEPPQWACEAIWYQIFVERFRNGDLSNDPTPASMKGAYPGYVPKGWDVTPWTQDWYEKDPWMVKAGKDFHELVAARRFGGDLQGVLDQLDYLQELGVTALYFNPLNDAPSLHKYDARHYRHIDRHFGPDPLGDSGIIASETPHDPKTWRWTSADRLFRKLIGEVHRRGMRLIIDFSWNHTGNTFWAWEDVRKNQRESLYRDWYEIDAFDDRETPVDEFAYHGWLGVKTLPEWRKFDVQGNRNGSDVFEGRLHPEVKAHMFNVTRRWLDPNGDGDPTDGVDGFRLDVAAHVPLGFWRDFRKFVRSINPDALLLGEAWWTKWPEQLMDPRPFLKGDIFDSVMHYQWYRPARRFFAQAHGGYKPSEFVKKLRSVYEGYSPSTMQCLMNLVASHDSPRLATSFQNKHQYKFKMGARDNPDLKLGPPDRVTLREMRMMLLHQYTFVSAPHIWNGDELGMWGADDPDCRKPLMWPDLAHGPQVYGPEGEKAKPIPVTPDLSLLAFHRRLILLRKSRPELLRGAITYLQMDDEAMTLAYSRSWDDHQSIAMFNRSDVLQSIVLKRDAPYEMVIGSESGCLQGLEYQDGQVRLQLAPLSAVLLNRMPIDEKYPAIDAEARRSNRRGAFPRK